MRTLWPSPGKRGQPSAYASASVTNSGYVATGPGSYAIGVAAKAVAWSYGWLSSAGAKATIMNSGEIVTYGADELPVSSRSRKPPLCRILVKPGLPPSRTSSTPATSTPTAPIRKASARVRIPNRASGTIRGYNGLATSYASTSVTNTGAIATSGDNSDGIRATSLASGYAYYGGLSSAYTTVNNSGAITTGGVGSVAISASSEIIKRLRWSTFRRATRRRLLQRP